MSGNYNSYETSLEKAFFLENDKKLIEKMREMQQMKKTQEAYTKVSGITNETILAKFVQLELPVDIVASLAVIPLIEVAWADGSVDAKEVQAIFEVAEKIGIEKGSIEFVLIEQWLTHPPEPKLLDAWIHYIEGVCENMNSDEKSLFKTNILVHIYAIAKASGGILGLGNKVSKSEQDVIDNLEKAFK